MPRIALLWFNVLLYIGSHLRKVQGGIAAYILQDGDTLEHTSR